MPFTSAEQHKALRQRARELLDDGTLPPAPSSAFGGIHGKSEVCALCGLRIGTEQLSYEVETKVGANMQALYFHPNCHAAWAAESRLRR